MIGNRHKKPTDIATPSPLFSRLAKITLAIAGCVLVSCLVGCKGQFTGVLNPKGIIALEERKLFFDTLALMLIVVLPVIVMSFTFVYHYQVSHRVTDYKPNWSHSYLLESLWWGIPCAIIVVLAVMTWKKTVQLDPYAKIAAYSNEAPMQVQAIALPWKWLFIYPEYNIATINELVVPINKQVEFAITADNVPMSAFFIPQLGSQIYAMAGMRTKLHLVATHEGTYDGLNSQINGDGFSDMHFTVRVVADNEMQTWVNVVKESKTTLDDNAYDELLRPSIGDKPKYFSRVKEKLFQNAIDVYMQNGNVHPRENRNAIHNMAHMTE
jgi:cytochrome o ubiquinol oxidase subunit 2